MAGYSGLLATFGELKNEIASFRRVILHAHSPDSYDYKGTTDIPLDIESSFKEALIVSKWDLVAITDHMKCDFACPESCRATTISKYPLRLRVPDRGSLEKSRSSDRPNPGRGRPPFNACALSLEIRYVPPFNSRVLRARRGRGNDGRTVFL
jgi:hypothetical protein